MVIDEKIILEINYKNRKYVKTIKSTNDSLEYKYYEKQGEDLKEIDDKDTKEFLKENYDINENNIIYEE